MDFLKAKPGHPPLKEYKQSMAMHVSPPPKPMKRKLKNYCIRIYWELGKN